VRFLRHLAAVLVVVAAVVLLALGWNHVAGGTVGAVRQGPVARIVTVRPRAGAVARGTRPGQPRGPVIIESQPMDLGLNSMLDPANLPSLRHTVVIEVAAAAAVVIIDVIRRRWRRARRSGS
jgi:phosphate starvation-inducible protein PhoH